MHETGETNTWGHQGRVSQQSSHTLSAPLVRVTSEHSETEAIDPGGILGAAPDFAIPTAVLHERPPQRLPEDSVCRSPIAGMVVDVAGAVGQAVKRNQMVLVIEAMKMQNHVGPAVDGVLKAVHVSAGDPVRAGQVLFELD